MLTGGSEEAMAAAMSANVMKRVFDLVLQYPFNNLLHFQVSGRMRRVSCTSGAS